MKQNITIKQWSEIPSVDVFVFYEKISSFQPGKFSPPSIGQMIEYLSEVDNEWFTHISQYNGNNEELSYDGELCDALWDAVKEKLEK